MDLLDRLLGHDQWAMERLFAHVRALTDEQLDTSFDLGLGSVRSTFQHVVFNIDAWTAEMKGADFDQLLPPGELVALTERYAGAFAAFAGFARECSETGRLAETFTDERGEQMTFAGAILHVILHNEGHRVEIVHMLQRLGCGEIEVDHGLWDHVSRGAVID